MVKERANCSGISIAVIKYVALLFMTIDHIGHFFPNTPIWFRYIGRLSSPLFFFAAAEGICHTHSKKDYLTRLYKLSVLLEVLKFIFRNLVGQANIKNNIFASIFHGTLIVYIFDNYKDNIKKRNILLALYCIWQAVTSFICAAINNGFNGNDSMSFILRSLKFTIFALLGNYSFSGEGAFYLTLMIVLFYFCRNNKKKLAVSYIVYCIVFIAVTALRIPYRLDNFAASIGLSYTMRDIVTLPFDLLGFTLFESLPEVPTLELMFKYHYQWMMIFALPLLLLYNGKRGNYPKKLFYIYYPLHLFVLAGLSLIL